MAEDLWYGEELRGRGIRRKRGDEVGGRLCRTGRRIRPVSTTVRLGRRDLSEAGRAHPAFRDEFGRAGAVDL